MVRKSPQATQVFVRENPKNLQHLTLLLENVTRWNSSYHMLARFQELKEAITWYLHTLGKGYEILHIFPQEWDQVAFLLQLLEPLKSVTQLLSQTKTTTLHRTFGVYDAIFNHLEDQEEIAINISSSLWTSDLKTAVDAGLNTLRKYYGRTKEPFGRFISLATILDPEIKLSLYEVC